MPTFIAVITFHDMLPLRSLKSHTARIRDAGSSVADLKALRQRSMAASRAAAAAALEAVAAGADEDEVHEAAEAAAGAAAAHAEDASASAASHPWADVVSELWMLLYDGAVVVVMIASVILMFLYTNASQTALQKVSSRFAQL